MKPYYAMKTLFPPGFANMADGRRFAISGIWIELTSDITEKMVRDAWEPLYPRKIEKESTEKIYNVLSERTGANYKVVEKNGMWNCNCPASEYHRSKECKHIKEQKLNSRR